jgi:hypothetical protein
MRPVYRALAPVGMALFNIGLQLSGYTNFPLACVLWTIAALLVLWSARSWLSELWPKTLLAEGGQPKEQKSDIPNVASQTAPLVRDVWLSDAIWRAYLGTWYIPPGDGLQELNVSESEKRRFAMLVIRDFRQIASDGTLPIWGWKGTSTIWEKVPNEFWKNNHIEHIQVATNGPQDEIKAQAENPYEQDTSKEWHHFMTSRAAVEQLYPSPQ